MTTWRLVCDVGGTNIRYARCTDSGMISQVVAIPVRECISLSSTLKTYADQFPDANELAGIAIAAAGPVDDGRVRLTNHDLTIDARDVSDEFSGKPVVVLNDLEAVAWSLPWLTSSDVRSIVVVDSALSGPRLVINVGTGFGGALLINANAGWHVIPCEPGHMTASSEIRNLRHDSNFQSRISVEDLISGQGLNAMLRNMRIDRDENLQHIDAIAPDIFAILKSQSNGQSYIDDFSALFGDVCGDLVLACGAWGGVYFCGSVARAWCNHGNMSAFQNAFKNKGRMRARMALVPVHEIIAAHPALIGLSAAAILKT
jgi:glucokinase